MHARRRGELFEKRGKASNYRKKAAKNMHAHSPAVGSYSFLSMLNT